MKKVILFLSLLTALPAYATSPVIINKNFQKTELGPYIEILEDKSGTLTIDEISKPEIKDNWFKSKSNIPNLGYTKSVFWIRFKVGLEQPHSFNEIYLKADYPLIDLIELYIPQKNIFIKKISGDSTSWTDREILNRNPIFKLKSEYLNEKFIYLRLKTEGNMVIPLSLLSPQYFYFSDHKDQLFFGIYFGVLLIMMIYNFIIFLILKDKNYILYVIFLMTLLLFSISFSGLLNEHLLPVFNNILNPLMVISTCILVFMSIIFAINFLESSRQSGFIHKCLIAMSAYSIIIGICVFFVDYSISARLVVVDGIITFILLFITSVIALNNGYRIARFYLIGWSFNQAGTIIVAIKNFGILPSMFITENGIFIANIFEISLLSLALADRINIIKQEKDDAQQEALKIQINATANLEQNVEERTKELALANAKLNELDRVKSNFFANISHEIRTPLTLILTPIESLLYKEKFIVPDKGFFESIYNNGLRLLGLMNNLLDFSKIDAGRSELSLQKINIIRLIQNHMEAVRSMAEVKGLKLLLDNSSPELLLFADPDKMDKIISNLFSNAIKFTGHGGMIIIKVYKEFLNDAEYCVFSISDTGIGIPNGQFKNIFDRFLQVDSDSSRKYEGTGIGLALVKEYVNLHNGTISVESRHIDLYPENHGSVFTVSILMIKENSAVSVSTESSYSDHHDSLSYNSQFIETQNLKTDFKNIENINTSDFKNNDEEFKMTILIVEDNPGMHKLLNDILEPQYRIISAFNGREALALLDSEEIPPDLVLSDVMMPEIDGYELTKRLRKDPRFEGIPVMLLTAMAEMDMKLEGFEKGAADYIIKPFNSMELSARIKSQIELKATRDRLIRANSKLYAKLVTAGRVNNSVSNSSEKKISRVMEFINENFTADISREGIASSVDMNPDNLSRMFNRITGKRIDAYINELRIKKSRLELAGTDKAVITIAMDAGFENLRTFNRVFRELEGMAPTEFRELNKVK